MQIMLCERSGKWETGEMEPPFGRGVMFQIAVDDIEAISQKLGENNWPIHSPYREVWRRAGDS